MRDEFLAELYPHPADTPIAAAMEQLRAKQRAFRPAFAGPGTESA